MANTVAQYDSTGCLASFANGAEGQVLQIVNGTPTWATLAVTCEDITDCVGQGMGPAVTGTGLTFTDATNTFAVNINKQVSNAGATLPIAAVANAGAQPLKNTSDVDQSAETNDIIPTIGADGVRRWTVRSIGVAANAVANPGATAVAATFVPVDFGTVTFNNNMTVTTGANWSVKVPVAGRYRLSARAGVINQTGNTFWADVLGTPAGGVELYPRINGTVQPQIGYWHNVTASNDIQLVNPHHIVVGGTAIYNLAAGDVVDVALFVNGFVNTAGTVLQTRGFGFQLERVFA